MLKGNSSEFINKSNNVHNNKYDYSMVDYIKNNIKVKIICPEHGLFEQTPNNHLRNKGCPKCSRNKRRLNGEKIFINKSKIIHKNKYDYSLVYYKTCEIKVKIICPEHGIFYQDPSSHLKGYGCSKCSGTNNKTTEEFIESSKLVHGEKYDYSLVNYINSTTKVIIICKIHGKFYQTPPNHLCFHNGCPMCNSSKKMNTNEFIEKSKLIHDNKYDYSLVEYKKAKIKIKIICAEHGIFEQTPSGHLSGRGCPKCGIKISKGEKEIANILDDNDINYIKEYEFNDCKYIKNLRFDFYLPEHRTCIEYDGKQHFESVDYFGGYISYNKIMFNDKIKNEFCIKNNINLIRIRYDENIKEKMILYNKKHDI